MAAAEKKNTSRLKAPVSLIPGLVSPIDVAPFSYSEECQKNMHFQSIESCRPKIKFPSTTLFTIAVDSCIYDISAPGADAKDGQCTMLRLYQSKLAHTWGPILLHTSYLFSRANDPRLEHEGRRFYTLDAKGGVQQLPTDWFPLLLRADRCVFYHRHVDGAAAGKIMFVVWPDASVIQLSMRFHERLPVAVGDAFGLITHPIECVQQWDGATLSEVQSTAAIAQQEIAAALRSPIEIATLVTHYLLGVRATWPVEYWLVNNGATAVGDVSHLQYGMYNPSTDKVVHWVLASTLLDRRRTVPEIQKKRYAIHLPLGRRSVASPDGRHYATVLRHEWVIVTFPRDGIDRPLCTMDCETLDHERLTDNIWFSPGSDFLYNPIRSFFHCDRKGKAWTGSEHPWSSRITKLMDSWRTLYASRRAAQEKVQLEISIRDWTRLTKNAKGETSVHEPLACNMCSKPCPVLAHGICRSCFIFDDADRESTVGVVCVNRYQCIETVASLVPVEKTSPGRMWTEKTCVLFEMPDFCDRSTAPSASIAETLLWKRAGHGTTPAMKSVPFRLTGDDIPPEDKFATNIDKSIENENEFPDHVDGSATPSPTLASAKEADVKGADLQPLHVGEGMDNKHDESTANSDSSPLHIYARRVGPRRRNWTRTLLVRRRGNVVCSRQSTCGIPPALGAAVGSQVCQLLAHSVDGLHSLLLFCGRLHVVDLLAAKMEKVATATDGDLDSCPYMTPSTFSVVTPWRSALFQQPNLSLYSWNVDGLDKRKWARIEQRLRSKQTAPDLLFLTETKLKQSALEGLFDSVRDQYDWIVNVHRPSNIHGVALLYRKTLTVEAIPYTLECSTRVDTVLSANEEKRSAEIGRLVVVLVNKSFVLVGSYVPNAGRHHEYRVEQWDLAFDKLISVLLSKFPRLLWIGDLNVAPDPLDVSHPEAMARRAGYTSEERGNFKKLLHAHKLVDTFRHLSPSARTYSWHGTEKDAGAHMRLDGAIASTDMLPRVFESQIEASQPLYSDHSMIHIRILL